VAVTKVVLCVRCADIVAPYPEPEQGWRWCQGRHAAGRWRDPHRGLLDVTALRPTEVRVIGLNNAFLVDAVQGTAWGDPDGINEEWRLLHDKHAEEVPPHYLFHENRRACWAVVIRPNETGDVRFVEFEEAAINAAPL
jgi:hypothetical protein